MSLFPAERAILAFSVLLFAIDCILMWWKDIAFDRDFFAQPLLLGAIFLAVGQVMRRHPATERLAFVMHLLGLVQLFRISCTAFNLLIAPLPGPMIDPLLVRVDALLGYSWPQWVAWIAQYPDLNAVIRGIYKLTLMQMVLAFVFVGLCSDIRRLHTCMLTAVIAAFLVVICWAAFPSGGAAAFWTLDPALEAAVQPIVGTAHGAEINRLVREGMEGFPPRSAPGLVGFPSFHTVMGLMALIAVWPHRWLRWPVMAISVLLIPGILIHGGHNLVDIPAGAAVTWLSWRLAKRILTASTPQPSLAT